MNENMNLCKYNLHVLATYLRRNQIFYSYHRLDHTQIENTLQLHRTLIIALKIQGEIFNHYRTLTVVRSEQK